MNDTNDFVRCNDSIHYCSLERTASKEFGSEYDEKRNYIMILLTHKCGEKYCIKSFDSQCLQVQKIKNWIINPLKSCENIMLKAIMTVMPTTPYQEIIIKFHPLLVYLIVKRM